MLPSWSLVCAFRILMGWPVMLGPIKPPTFPVCTSLMTCGWPAKQETSYQHNFTDARFFKNILGSHLFLVLFCFLVWCVCNMQNRNVFWVFVFVNHPTHTFDNYFCYNSFVFSLFLYQNRKVVVFFCNIFSTFSLKPT